MPGRQCPSSTWHDRERGRDPHKSVREKREAVTNTSGNREVGDEYLTSHLLKHSKRLLNHRLEDRRNLGDLEIVWAQEVVMRILGCKHRQ